MGFRFRKSFKIAPGIKINISKKGISSVSLGRPGATVNINRKGTRTTLGLPGTGLSHSSYSPHAKKLPPQLPTQQAPFQSQQNNQKLIMGYPLSDWIIGLVIMFIMAWILITVA